MTAGLVVVLGETGRNFGAGMAAGTAYVLDELDDFEQRYNPEMVSIERVSALEDRDELYRMIALHLEKTGSRRAQEILEHWDEYLPRFWKVVPHPPIVTRDHDTYTAFGAKQEAVVAAHHQPRSGAKS
jgi:glutamate synthase domain-containing protein 3